MKLNKHYKYLIISIIYLILFIIAIFPTLNTAIERAFQAILYLFFAYRAIINIRRFCRNSAH